MDDPHAPPAAEACMDAVAQINLNKETAGSIKTGKARQNYK